MLTRTQIREKLPRGAMKRIAAKAKVTGTSVTRYFAGRSQNKRIAEATAEVLEELKEESREVNERIMAALS